MTSIAKFDRTLTIQENFPKILRPSPDAVDMQQCKLDTTETVMPLTLSECVEEFKTFYYDDNHMVYMKILKFIEEMLDKELLTDEDDNALTRDSKEVKEFLESEIVVGARSDDKLFDYLYDQLCTLDDLESGESKWTKYIDEPDKRVFYMFGEGEAYQSTITDCIVEAPYEHVLACYDNLEVLEELMPDMYEPECLKKVSQVKGLMHCKQKFPWPLAHRDLVISVTGMPDFKNRAAISVSKSVDESEKYFGYSIPAVPEGFSRIDVKMGYNFIQYLGPNKTRHVAIWNTDPKIDYVPAFFQNYVLTNVLYTNMTNLQKFAAKLENAENDPEIYKYYKRKQIYYQFVTDVILEPEVVIKAGRRVTTADCPDHPANPNHPDHDPEKAYW